MELFLALIDILKDVPDEPVITESGSGMTVFLIIGVIVIAAVLFFVLFKKKKPAA